MFWFAGICSAGKCDVIFYVDIAEPTNEMMRLGVQYVYANR